jgi:glutaredoxin
MRDKQMSNIIVYSKKDCPNCDMLKGLLREENVEYKIVRIDTPEALTELGMNNVFTMSAPVLQVDKKFYTIRDMTTPGLETTIDRNIVMEIIGKIETSDNDI